MLGGKPAPVITWRAVDGRGRSTTLPATKKTQPTSDLGFSLANDVTETAADGTSTTTVVLSKRLSREDLASTIECHVEHEAVKAGALDSRVALDVNGKCGDLMLCLVLSGLAVLNHHRDKLLTFPLSPLFSPLFTVGIKTMEIIGPSTSVREGDVAVIECVAYGSKPAAEIVWRNG